jgi:hypothetical protein
VLYRGLVGKREGKRPLVGPKRRWKDNIKIEIKNRMKVSGPY